MVAACQPLHLNAPLSEPARIPPEATFPAPPAPLLPWTVSNDYRLHSLNHQNNSWILLRHMLPYMACALSPPENTLDGTWSTVSSHSPHQTSLEKTMYSLFQSLIHWYIHDKIQPLPRQTNCCKESKIHSISLSSSCIPSFLPPLRENKMSL